MSVQDKNKLKTSLLLLVTIVLTAAICAAGAVFISTNAWAEWFQHPARQPIPDVTLQGAALWQLMLGVTAISLLVASFLIQRIRCSQDQSIEHKSNPLLIVSGIVIVAFVARSTRISESLWYDEIASWLAYGAGVDRIGPIIGNYFDPVNHVFHTVLSWISVECFENFLGSEIAFRMPALIFSLVSVVAIYGFTRSTTSKRTAILAAILAAILPVSVLEGGEARGYSMMICFSALATWSLVEALQLQRPWLWCVYVLTCTLGIWAHMVTVFVPVGHGVVLCWITIKNQSWKDTLPGYVALLYAALLTITLYSPLLPDLLNASGMFFSSRGDEPTIFGTEGRHALYQLGGSWYWWAALPGLLLFLFGLIAAIRENKNDRLRSATGFALAGLPLIVVVIVLSGSWIYARFTFFALPGAILLIATGIDKLWNWRREVGIAVVCIVIGCSLADLIVRPAKQPLREAAQYVRNLKSDDEQLLVIGLAHEVLRIYAGDLNLTYLFWHGRELDQFLTEHSPDWIVIEYPNSVLDQTYTLLGDNGYKKVNQFHGWVDWTNGDVLVFRKINRVATQRLDPDDWQRGLDTRQIPSQPSRQRQMTR